MPKLFNTRFVKGRKHMIEILNLIAPQRFYYIYFDVACMEVFDRCTDILKSIQTAIDQEEIGADEKRY